MAVLETATHHTRLVRRLMDEFGAWSDARKAAADWLVGDGWCEAGDAFGLFTDYQPDAGRFSADDQALHIVEVAGSSPITTRRLKTITYWASALDDASCETIIHVVPLYGSATSVDVTGLWPAAIAGADLAERLFIHHSDMPQSTRQAHREIGRIVDRERASRLG